MNGSDKTVQATDAFFVLTTLAASLSYRVLMTNDAIQPRRVTWLSERIRSTISVAFAALVGISTLPFLGNAIPIATGDGAVFMVLAYLVAYLAVTVWGFSRASPVDIATWAHRESRGTILQRYILGTAPGPGVSLFIAAIALVIAMVWLPGHAGTSLHTGARIGIGISLIVVAWFCVVVSYAVTFHADNLLEDDKGLDFPDDDDPEWADYVYFAISVMTTFGTTDVNVMSRAMRRTVTVNAVIAFVFNTVTVAAGVSALTK